MTFNQDLDAMRQKLKIVDSKITSFYKKNVIYTTTGLPASSTPREFLKAQGEIPHMQAQVAAATGGKKSMGTGGPQMGASGRGGPVQLRAIPTETEVEEIGGGRAPGGPRGRGGPRGGPAQRGGGGPPRGGPAGPGGPAQRGGAGPGGPAQRGGGGPPRGGPAGPGGPAQRGGAGPGGPAQRGGGGPPRGGPAQRGGPPGGGGRGGGPPPAAAPAPSLPKCRALFDYGASEDDELTLREGDVIEITNKSGEWWEGILNGKTGVFPANYVEEI